MNLHALYHKPQSEYAFPISRDRAVVRLRAAANDLKKVEIVIKLKYSEKPVCTLPMKKRFTDSLFDYYETEIDTSRGRRVYYFVVTDHSDNRVYYIETGAVAPEYVSDSYFPHFQLPFVSDSDILSVPEKFRNATVYQIFPDRFYTSKPKLDWKKRPHGMDVFGGELWGAAEKLDYIRSLGINTVYVTPINPSHTSHHYDVEDYYRVSDELGGDAAFKTFVERAHALGIKVILDGVFNHCSALNPMFRDVAEKGRASEFYDWFLINGDKPDFKKCNYETFAWNVAYMPKFNCDNPKVVDFVSGVAVHWIKKFGIDAWRLDVADDVAPALWRHVRAAVKAADANAIMIGENWMDANATLGGDVFDGVMNYGFARAVRDWLAFRKIDAFGAAERLVRNYMHTNAPSANMMMNLIGSHDTHRFYTLCGENTFNHIAALCVMFFYDGMPTVYYGDELPMAGDADPDCRRGFDWSKTGGKTSDTVRLLAGMRAAEERGTTMSIECDNGVLVMERGADTLRINATGGDIHTKRNGAVGKRTIAIDACGEHAEIKE
ncbi:MAG: glycoside hydrolase family 13 protein [Roseburia sp.]|nr:glycoside hydrolase family 13 protein [Roseburia sp.]